MDQAQSLSALVRDEAASFRPRREGRHEVDAVATLARERRRRIEVRVRNLSTTGFMADCVEPVRIGSYISLDVPGIGPVQAQVRWQLGRCLGGMFLDPISLSRCEWTARSGTLFSG
jgi:hypothetical protein